MKYHLPRSAERNDHGVLLIFIQEKRSKASSKLHLRSTGTQPGVSRANLPHIFRAIGMYRDAAFGSD